MIPTLSRHSHRWSEVPLNQGCVPARSGLVDELDRRRSLLREGGRVSRDTNNAHPGAVPDAPADTQEFGHALAGAAPGPVGRVMRATCIGLAGICVLAALTGLSENSQAWTVGVYNVLLVLLCVSMWTRVARPAVSRADIVWLAIALSGWTVGNITYGVYQVLGAEPQFPSVADVGYALTYLGMLAAVIGALRRERQRATAAILLDASIAALGAALVLTLILHPLTPDLTPAALLTTAAYPITDLVVVALIVGKITLCVGPDRAMWRVVGLGVLLFALADTVYVRQIQAGTYHSGTLLDTLWLLGALAITTAVMLPQRPRDMAKRALAEQYALSLLATVLGFAVLVYAAFRPLSTISILLAAGTLLLVVVRTHVAIIALAKMADVRQQAVTDELTGLANRRSLFAHLPARLADTTTGRRRPAVMVLDLDNFKTINDQFGHAVGDAVLVALAGRLRSRMRGDDLVARLGGDEFAVIATVGDDDEARQLAARIAAGVAEPVQTGDALHAVRASIGLVRASPGEDADTVLRRADEAMYRAKAAGGGVFEGGHE